MRHIEFFDFLILIGWWSSSVVVVVVSGVVIPDSHLKSQHATKMRDKSPQKCDLVCPGQPSLALPPNFLQNCTSPNNPAHNGSSTSPRPSINSTTASSEEESSEKTRSSRKYNAKNLKKRHQLKLSNKTGGKIRMKTLKLNREMRSRMFGHQQGFTEKRRVDGCYVICADEQQASGGGDDNGSDSLGSDSDEFDNDNYVEGEDTAIEIIYVPTLNEESKRPSEVYQINNYELVEPAWGYNPFFYEGKHKKINRRKRPNRRKSGNKINNKSH